MIGAAKIIAFGATRDSAKSRAFYEGLLGLRFVDEDAYACIYDAHGIELRIQKVRTLTPQPHTLLGWTVASIDEVIKSLVGKGVAFERYPFLNQDPQGVWTAPSGAQIAWMKDPDGNLLSLTQSAQVARQQPP
jgi:catechol 2,3-dioxygenase-like lactoylglutathione lyase family enzyme